MAKFYAVSDLHVDFRSEEIMDLFDWKSLDSSLPLVVAGDVSNNYSVTMKHLTKLKTHFDNVLFLPGNHDVIERNTIHDVYKQFSYRCRDNDIVFLHRNSFSYDDVTFVGATGWYNFAAGEPYSSEEQENAWMKHMIDYSQINWGYLPVATVKSIAQIDADFLKIFCADRNNTKIVVATHMVPRREFLKQRAGNATWNKLNGSFCNTELEDVDLTNVAAWIYGHAHYRNDKMVDNTRFICNALGYPDENKGIWFPVEVDV